MRKPRWQDLPKCPKCGGPSVPSEVAIRGDERPRGQLGCLACGDTWKGSPRQLEKAWEAERSWQRKELRDEAASEWAAKVTRDQEKLERLKRGAW